MKKKIPNLINIKIPSNSLVSEQLHINAIHQDFEEGYNISDYDKQLYCAIKIKEQGIDSLPESIKTYYLQDEDRKTNIQFHKIRLEKLANKFVSQDDEIFFINYLKGKIICRMSIIRKEINRLGVNAKKISFSNSEHLRTLLSFVNKLDDEVTLIRWFISIRLSFEKCIHIFIKHVEETKFGKGSYSKRTFFNYEFDEIFTLVKIILQQEKENIQNHFLKVAVAKELNEQENIKEYINNWVKYNGDVFALAIDTNGYITKFHQKN